MSKHSDIDSYSYDELTYNTEQKPYKYQTGKVLNPETKEERRYMFDGTRWVPTSDWEPWSQTPFIIIPSNNTTTLWNFK